MGGAGGGGVSDDAKKVLAYLRGHVGHEGAQYGGAIRNACGMGKKRFDVAATALVDVKLVRTASGPRGLTYSPMPW